MARSTIYLNFTARIHQTSHLSTAQSPARLGTSFLRDGTFHCTALQLTMAVVQCTRVIDRAFKSPGRRASRIECSDSDATRVPFQPRMFECSSMHKPSVNHPLSVRSAHQTSYRRKRALHCRLIALIAGRWGMSLLLQVQTDGEGWGGWGGGGADGTATPFTK